ncbi:MAG: sensor histidine kinase [Alphaproteobacteria bacterium]|nr:sensor histidine kinase [Alphaproteobacteria bacterium]MBU1526608.1 sensor histidine kinase [Alphaproteobacteria bacterium]MBU2118072.1 sensor histidine kinase [Alphaproteobacteria bacterium]MBU2351577.1 sensor histidine kinase [Alphaproteobacteria bacterium]MBU2383144.1 sensor histidine kinase [Alphaproteobacteria bacterium]
MAEVSRAGDQHPGSSGPDSCCRFLQTLVAIRLRTVDDPEARRHLGWISDMAAAVSLMSARNAQGDPFDAYVEDTLTFWRRSFEARGVRLEVRGRVGDLPEAQRLPLAVILHELLTNATKHAFPEGRGGALAVAFSATRSGLSLVVRDTGVGAAEPRKGDGLSLIEGLVARQDGSLALETSPGAGFAVRIGLPSGAELLN